MVKTKTVTIALGVICLILATSLAVVVVTNENLSGNQNNQSLEEQVSSLNMQISTLQNQISNLNSALSDYEMQLYDYEEHIVALTNQIIDYNNIIDLKESHVLLDKQTYTQNATTVTTLFNEKVSYAGYFEIQVESTSDTTYIQISYTHNNLNFDQTITVGTNGTAYFPILPGTIETLLGNTDTKTNNATITITYIY